MAAVTPDLSTQHAPLAALASRYVDIENLPWRDTRWPGIRVKMLMEDKERGLATMLMRWEPGAALPDHEHVEIEQTYVIEGSFEDAQGICRAGQFVWRPAGSRHDAWTTEGALMLAFFLKPNRFFDQMDAKH